MMTVTLDNEGYVSVSSNDSIISAGTLEDSRDFLEWFVGTTDKSVFDNPFVFNGDGVMVKLVKE